MFTLAISRHCPATFDNFRRMHFGMSIRFCVLGRTGLFGIMVRVWGGRRINVCSLTVNSYARTET